MMVVSICATGISPGLSRLPGVPVLANREEEPTLPGIREVAPSSRRNAPQGDCKPALRSNMLCSHLYTSRRTLLTSSSSLNGLVMYISAPCRNPQDLSSGVFLLVNKIIGIFLLASRLFSLRHN